jgi:hypothetical protein
MALAATPMSRMTTITGTLGLEPPLSVIAGPGTGEDRGGLVTPATEPPKPEEVVPLVPPLDVGGAGVDDEVGGAGAIGAVAVSTAATAWLSAGPLADATLVPELPETVVLRPSAGPAWPPGPGALASAAATTVRARTAAASGVAARRTTLDLIARRSPLRPKFGCGRRGSGGLQFLRPTGGTRGDGSIREASRDCPVRLAGAEASPPHLTALFRLHSRQWRCRMATDRSGARRYRVNRATARPATPGSKAPDTPTPRQSHPGRQASEAGEAGGNRHSPIPTPPGARSRSRTPTSCRRSGYPRRCRFRSCPRAPGSVRAHWR